MYENDESKQIVWENKNWTITEITKKRYTHIQGATNILPGKPYVYLLVSNSKNENWNIWKEDLLDYYPQIPKYIQKILLSLLKEIEN